MFNLRAVPNVHPILSANNHFQNNVQDGQCNMVASNLLLMLSQCLCNLVLTLSQRLYNVVTTTIHKLVVCFKSTYWHLFLMLWHNQKHNLGHYASSPHPTDTVWLGCYMPPPLFLPAFLAITLCSHHITGKPQGHHVTWCQPVQLDRSDPDPVRTAASRQLDRQRGSPHTERRKTHQLRRSTGRRDTDLGITSSQIPRVSVHLLHLHHPIAAMCDATSTKIDGDSHQIHHRVLQIVRPA